MAASNARPLRTRPPRLALVRAKSVPLFLLSLLNLCSPHSLVFKRLCAQCRPDRAAQEAGGLPARRHLEARQGAAVLQHAQGGRRQSKRYDRWARSLGSFKCIHRRPGIRVADDVVSTSTRFRGASLSLIMLESRGGTRQALSSRSRVVIFLCKIIFLVSLVTISGKF